RGKDPGGYRGRGDAGRAARDQRQATAHQQQGHDVVVDRALPARLMSGLEARGPEDQGFRARTNAESPARRLSGKNGSSAAQIVAKAVFANVPCFLRLLFGTASPRAANRTAAASG